MPNRWTTKGEQEKVDMDFELLQSVKKGELEVVKEPHLKECSALTKMKLDPMIRLISIEYSYHLSDRIDDAMVDWYPNHLNISYMNMIH